MLKSTARGQPLYLIEIFASIESLVALLLQIHCEGKWLLKLLPGLTATVAIQGIVSHQVVVRIAASQDAAAAGTAQWSDCKLKADILIHATSSYLLPPPHPPLRYSSPP